MEVSDKCLGDGVGDFSSAEVFDRQRNEALEELTVAVRRELGVPGSVLRDEWVKYEQMAEKYEIEGLLYLDDGADVNLDVFLHLKAR